MSNEPTGMAGGAIQADPEYPQARVPYRARRNILSPLVVWIGYAFFPAGVAAAISLGGSYSFADAGWITLAGCLILALVSGIMGSIGQREGMSTALIARFTYGSVGYKVAALVTPIGLIGWNSIHISIASSFVQRIYEISMSVEGAAPVSAPYMYYVSCIVMAFVFGFIAVKGFKYVAIVGYICVPVVIFLLGYAASRGLAIIGGWSNLFSAVPKNVGRLTIAAGVTGMVGTFACGAGGGSADIQRWNKTNKQSWAVAILTFAIAYPYLMLSGTITALATDTTSIVDAYIKLGILIMGGIIIVFLTWTTCDTDYYAASLSFSAVTGANRKRAVVVIVSCACILALLKSGDILSYYLTAMSAIMLPPVGIAAADYFVINNGKYPEPSVALKQGLIPDWKYAGFVSLFVGAVSLFYFNNMNWGIPPIQCMIVAGIVHIICCKIFPQKSNFNDLINAAEKEKAFNAEPVRE